MYLFFILKDWIEIFCVTIKIVKKKKNIFIILKY